MKTVLMKTRLLSCLSISAILLFMLATSIVSLDADDTPSLVVLPLEGVPMVMSPNRAPFKLISEVSLHPNDYIQTGPGDRALLRFEGDTTCRFILDTNSVLKNGNTKTHRVHRAFLLNGTVIGENTSCRAMLDLKTREGSLHGKNATYLLQALNEKTRIQIVIGSMQFHIRGKVVPLRAKTLTTISRGGNHRISSIARIKGQGVSRRTNFAGTAFKGGMLPIAVTAGQP